MQILMSARDARWCLTAGPRARDQDYGNATSTGRSATENVPLPSSPCPPSPQQK
jgi:hypothetical protein